MSNNIRTRISNLPLCEDVEILDSLIGIGTDGKTYRVEKDLLTSGNAGTGGSGGSSGEPSSSNIKVFNRDLEDYIIIEGGTQLEIKFDNKYDEMMEYFDNGGRLYITFGNTGYFQSQVSMLIGYDYCAMNGLYTKTYSTRTTALYENTGVVTFNFLCYDISEVDNIFGITVEIKSFDGENMDASGLTINSIYFDDRAI